MSRYGGFGTEQTRVELDQRTSNLARAGAPVQAMQATYSPYLSIYGSIRNRRGALARRPTQSNFRYASCRMTERSDFYWGDTAQSYDAERRGSSIWRREDEIVGHVLRAFASGPDAITMDLPVGTGRFAGLIGDLGHRLVGVDLSEDMLTLAKKRLIAPGLLAQASATRLPIRSACIDVAICIRFAHLVPRSIVQQSLAEMNRVLRDEGFVVMGIRLHSIAGDDLAGRWKRVLQRIFRSAAFRFGRARSHSHPRRWFAKALSSAGLVALRQWNVTRYADGSVYSIFLLRPADEPAHAPSIELFGLPGVGKTTVARRLMRAEEFGLRDGLMLTEPLSLQQAFRKHPIGTAGFMLGLIPVLGQVRDLAARRVVISALRQKLVDIESMGTVLHEEGSAHEAWRQLFAGGNVSDRLIARVLPVSDVVVFLEAPTLDLIERLAEKSSPGPISRTLMSRSTDDELWDRAARAYQTINQIIAAGKGAVRTIDNSGQVEEASAAALERIVLEAERGFKK